MNIAFLTQSKSLRLFHDLALEFRNKEILSQGGLYIADSRYYEEFCGTEHQLDSFKLLKEWEIIEKALNIKPDIDKLREYEQKIADPVLWNAIVVDRRLYYGKRTSLEQDYCSRFSNEQLLAILQTAIEEIENWFLQIKPDLVVTFVCVTLGEYLSYLIAKSQKIPFLNLRSMRVRNCIFAGETILEPSIRLEKIYQKYLKDGFSEQSKEQACAFLEDARSTHAMYEGVAPPPTKTPIKTITSPRRSLLKRLKNLFKRHYEYTYGKYRYDTYHQGSLWPLWWRKVKNPWRQRKNIRYLQKVYINPQEIPNLDFAFFPLHKEPEVSLNLFGRPFLNQIEVVRCIARNLPVGMKLILKEHPKAIDYRTLAYYKKLLSVPNVLLAPPYLKSKELVEYAKLITVISGSIGFEGAISKKPVITLGYSPFEFLPDTMLKRVANLQRLGMEIRDILKEHQHQEDALIAFVAAIIDHSVKVDFYSVLLGRKNAYRPGEDQENNYWAQISRLQQYIMEQYPALKEDTSHVEDFIR